MSRNMDCRARPRAVWLGPGMTSRGSTPMVPSARLPQLIPQPRHNRPRLHADGGVRQPGRSQDVNQTLTSCGDDIFGWSMRPWESVPAPAADGQADSHGRMDQPIEIGYRPMVAQRLTGHHWARPRRPWLDRAGGRKNRSTDCRFKPSAVRSAEACRACDARQASRWRAAGRVETALRSILREPVPGKPSSCRRPRWKSERWPGLAPRAWTPSIACPRHDDETA
jgi:hypothetical protein